MALIDSAERSQISLKKKKPEPGANKNGEISIVQDFATSPEDDKEDE